MQRTCRQCHAAFEITQDDLAFYALVSPVFNGKKELIPPPTLCPECRQQRRQAHINELHLYRRQCGFTGKSVISCFVPESPYVVYDQEVWYSDRWDPLSYGRPFDFSRPFFEQFRELSLAVPYPNLVTAYQSDENSAYTNYAGRNKNCYLIFDSDENRDCAYGYSVNGCTDCLDCYRSRRCERCYECIDCMQCYDSVLLKNCVNCSSSSFLDNCTGCRNCFFCSNLRNKENYIQNKQVTKEEVARARASLVRWSTLRQQQSQFDQWKLRFPQKYIRGVQNEEVSGDYLIECKNAFDCFDSEHLWDCRRVYQAFMAVKDSQDLNECGEAELCYEDTCIGYNAHHILFSNTGLDQLSDLLYVSFCFHCKHCFGCIGLNRKSFCILNRQYTKEEYERLVPQIIEQMRKTGEWGELFPIAISTFAYNESLAQDHYPLKKEEVEKRGWKWREERDEMPKVSKVIPAEKLPDSIDDVPDDILNWAIECEATIRPFKIIKQELDFYRQMKLPVPHFHPDERHRRRMALRNPRKLWKRECMKCGKEMQTTYSPERPEIVYCEECYLKEVY